MQNMPVDMPLNTVRTAPDDIFAVQRKGLAAADIPALREALGAFLAQKGVATGKASDAKLVLTEILSNLLKHPPAPARSVAIRAEVTPLEVLLDVADDSTPFASFDARCKAVEKVPHTIATTDESGYGLTCILKAASRLRYTGAAASADGRNHFAVALRQGAAGEELLSGAAKRKIFLIDDDRVALQVYEMMLGGEYDIVSFGSAEDALAAFPEERPDLIISDLMMPEMDGICLRRTLAGMEGGNDTPFIFLSGGDPAEHEAYISQLGVDDFLCKPVTQERLSAVVSRLLRRAEQVREAVESRFSRDITALLRPALPESFGGWRFSLRHAPAGAGGGDFIINDAAPDEQGGALTMALADVMGHDSQAKFFSYVYAGYLRSLFRMRGTADPSQLLKQLSEAAGGDELLDAMTMTCQCCRFTAAGGLDVASAGHPRPLLLRRGQAPEILDVMGPLPGLAGDSVYRLKHFTLAPGDKVVFMTDGFLDVFDRKGKAAEALAAVAAGIIDAGDVTDTLWEEFSRRQGAGGDKDDATLVVAEFQGGGA